MLLAPGLAAQPAPAPAAGAPTALSEPAEAGSEAADEDAAAFAAGFDELHAAMDDGRWDAARRRLQALLDDPRMRPFLRARRDEVELDLRRVAFFESLRPPEADELVAGDLVMHNPTNGRVKVRYRDRAALRADAELVEPASGARCRLHPLDFSGAHSIEVRGPAGAEPPPVWIAVGEGEAWRARVEPRPGIAGDGAQRVGARLDRIAGGTITTVAASDDVGLAARPRYTFSVQVAGGRLTLRFNGRTVLRAAVPRDMGGRAGIGGPGHDDDGTAAWDEVTLEGHGGTGWIGGLRDAFLREQWSAFTAALDGRPLLPAWASAGQEGAPTALDAAEEAALRERLRARLLHARRTAARGDLQAALDDLAALGSRHPGFAAPWEAAAELLLLGGRPGPAEDVLVRADAAGARSERLATLRATLVKARRGPDWLSWQRRVTEHFDVRTDLDAHLAEDAALALENAYRFFRDDLGSGPGSGAPLRAYIFSGRRGFVDYTRDVLGLPFPSAAGVYTPVLGQLLAWNLPDRAALFATLRHEGFHQFAHRTFGELPVWLNEGLAEYYEASREPGGRWRPGRLAPDHLRVLAAPGALAPLAGFLALDAEGFYADPSRHYAQAWALAHLLRHGDADHAALLAQLLAGARAGLRADDAVAAALRGRDLDELDAQLASHVAGMRR